MIKFSQLQKLGNVLGSSVCLFKCSQQFKNKHAMKGFLIIFIIFIFYSCRGQDFTKIPYKQTNPFYSAEILPGAFLDFVKINKIKSIDLLMNGKITKDFLVFNDNGQLISKNYFGLIKRDYQYLEGNLIKIKNPGKIFCMDNPDSIIFYYNERLPKYGLAYQNNDTIGKVTFDYYPDSIITKSYYPDYLNSRPIQKDSYFYKGKRIIKETHTSHYENEYQIDYIYNGELLTNYIWSFYGKCKDQSFEIKDGLVASSIYYYAGDNCDRTVFRYNENDIEEKLYDCKGEDIGYLRLILNKK
jgi:hypothetical protein